MTVGGDHGSDRASGSRPADCAGSGPRIVSVNVSEAKGTAKTAVGDALVDCSGLSGDAHRDVPGRGVSLLGLESIEAFSTGKGIEVAPGELGENITTAGLDPALLSPGDLLEAGEALLEVTAVGKTCHGDRCSIFRRVGACAMPASGVFCRVLRGGRIAVGDPCRPVAGVRKC